MTMAPQSLYSQLLERGGKQTSLKCSQTLKSEDVTSDGKNNHTTHHQC